MMHVSLTRLRIRSPWLLPVFFLHATRSEKQVRAAAGFRAGALLPDRKRTFWTMTLWDSPESMRAFMTSGAHMQAMPKLLHWCDQASVAHWETDDSTLPTWEHAAQRMRTQGRASKVLRPAAGHADLTYDEPRLTVSKPIAPK